MLGEDIVEPEKAEDMETPSDEPSVVAAVDGFEQFIIDITPFFYRHTLTYVDVGAFDGTVFTKLQSSRLALREAHLIEPNPDTFAKLQAVKPAKSTQAVNLYNMAVSDKDGIVRMQAAHTMTRVIEGTIESPASSIENANSFEVKCAALDDMAHLFLNRHISILKVDVEGHEQKVLQGAANLFTEQRVDILYIEAGADPETAQQCYYRLIDDEMAKYGYRLFRIYEQTHEWMEDSPALRRMNLAYMSPRFVSSNPYRLSRELLALRDESKALQRKLDKAEERVSQVRDQRESAQRISANLREQLAAQIEAASARLAEREAAFAAHLGASQAELARVRRALKKARESAKSEQERRSQLLRNSAAETAFERARNAELTKRLALIQSSISWRVTAPVRRAKDVSTGLLRRVKARLSAREAAAPAPRTNLVAPTPTTPDLATLPPLPAKSYEDKLWGGFSGRALRDLEALKADPKRAAEAAWALACWYAAAGNYQRGAQNAALARTRGGSSYTARLLVEAFCRVQLKQAASARALLEPAVQRAPDNIDLLLGLANAQEDDTARLALINRALSRSNLAPLQKIDAGRTLGVDNLTTGPLPVAGNADQPKVSVILPIFNGAKTIGFVLEGLANQTWRNIEIIAVDDCSTDDSARIIQSYVARDSRFKLLRQGRNQGSYSARNRGLSVATGDFITVHDANDWSHPQKIELQARHLLGDQTIAGNFSNWARVVDNLIFVGKFRRKDKIVDWNPSSFFFRRSLIAQVGGWDSVRISADAELIRRAREVLAGQQEIRAIPETAPLAFAYDDDTSLTKHSATHGRTIFHGFRREYKEASTHWHATATRAELQLRPGLRRFPAPGPILADRDDDAAFDLLYVADFNADDTTRIAALKDLDQAVARGQRVAVFNWRAYDGDTTAPLPISLRQRAQDGKLRVISPGEKLEAELVIVATPTALTDMIDLAPKVTPRKLRVLTGRGARLEDATQTRAHLLQTFGSEGEWLGESNQDAAVETP